MHKKKMLPPIIITAIVVLYYVAFACYCFAVDGFPLGLKILIGAGPLNLAAICIYLLIERIEEIKEGEEDDLSKY